MKTDPIENKLNWPNVDCQCVEYAKSCGGCVCGPEERVLRAFLDPNTPLKMTPEQREWCYAEIDAIESHDRSDYEAGTDAELARGVLNAWTDYCRGQGLL